MPSFVLTLAREGSLAGVESPDQPGLMVQAITLLSPDGVVMTASAVFDSTGAFCFNLDSLPKLPTYDGSGNLTSLTVGPDSRGKSIRQTSTYVNNIWQGDSAWVLQ